MRDERTPKDVCVEAICSYACSSRRSASEDGAKESFSSALHFAPNSPLLARMEQAILVSRASWRHDFRAQASRRLWGREWEKGTGYMFIRIHLLGL